MHIFAVVVIVIVHVSLVWHVRRFRADAAATRDPGAWMAAIFSVAFISRDRRAASGAGRGHLTPVPRVEATARRSRDDPRPVVRGTGAASGPSSVQFRPRDNAPGTRETEWCMAVPIRIFGGGLRGR